MFRPVDWGGTWTPVTVSHDDHVNGIEKTTGPGYLTTSGVPGEVAVSFFDGGVSYWKDYGVTWHAIGGAPDHGNQILWGHAGRESVLLLVYDDMYAADMTSASRRFVRMTRP